VLVAVLVTGLGGSVCSGGFRVASHDAEATARGEAFAATADNPSAIYYNPAGITQLPGHQLRAGVYGLYIDATFNEHASNQRDLHPVPHLFYTFKPQQLPLAFGLGLYAPYGLSSEWPEDTGFRTVGIEGNLKYGTVNPVVAWQILPTLSVGAGPTFNYSELNLRQGVLLPIPNSDSFEFKGDDLFVGFNLGLLWKAHPKLHFGAAYRSETSAGYQGSTKAYGLLPPDFSVPFGFQQDATGRLAFPQHVVGGISYRPTPRWNLEVNVDWTDWERLNVLTIGQAAAAPPLFPQNLEVPLHWDSSFYYELGVTRTLSEAWQVSAGYIYNENSVPDATYNPLVADLNRHFISVGTAYLTRALDLSIAYQFGYGPARSVSGSLPSAAGQSADGKYRYLSHALSLSLAMRF
jgi:long-chain fatty acid transport protein